MCNEQTPKDAGEHNGYADPTVYVIVDLSCRDINEDPTIDPKDKWLGTVLHLTRDAYTALQLFRMESGFGKRIGMYAYDFIDEMYLIFDEDQPFQPLEVALFSHYIPTAEDNRPIIIEPARENEG